MMRRYTIGELARAADVPTSTIRYYERRGLLRPTARSGSNYRLYDEQALERLRFVRAAQSAGFTLSDIGVLVRLRDDDDDPRGEVRALIEARLDEVAREAARLQHVEDVLHGWLGVCRRAETGRCGVLAGLGHDARCDDEETRESP